MYLISWRWSPAGSKRWAGHFQNIGPSRAKSIPSLQCCWMVSQRFRPVLHLRKLEVHAICLWQTEAYIQQAVRQCHKVDNGEIQLPYGFRPQAKSTANDDSTHTYLTQRNSCNGKHARICFTFKPTHQLNSRTNTSQRFAQRLHHEWNDQVLSAE